MRKLIIILLIFPFVVNGSQWYENGKPIPDQENKKSKNGFGAMIQMTTNSQQALGAWSKPTKGVWMQEASKVEKGKPIEALVLFSGCKANKDGNCISEIDYKILKPDGTVYVEYKNAELWKNKPPIPNGRLGLAVDRAGMIADPEDPLGVYKMVCKVRDLVRKVELTLITKFEVIKANK